MFPSRVTDLELRLAATEALLSSRLGLLPHGWGHNGGWRAANGRPGVNINRLLPSGPDAVERVSGVTFIDGLPVEVTRVRT